MSDPPGGSKKYEDHITDTNDQEFRTNDHVANDHVANYKYALGHVAVDQNPLRHAAVDQGKLMGDESTLHATEATKLGQNSAGSGIHALPRKIANHENTDDQERLPDSRTPCKLWARRVCCYGDKCTFSHAKPGGATIAVFVHKPHPVFQPSAHIVGVQGGVNVPTQLCTTNNQVAEDYPLWQQLNDVRGRADAQLTNLLAHSKEMPLKDCSWHK
jgi:hypothetical protein